MTCKEYVHVAIDKQGIGLANLRNRFDQNGLQTAQDAGIALSGGSMKLEHHLHVFLWDNTANGIKGISTCYGDGSSSVVIRVRWLSLTEPGWIFSGSLKGDNMQDSPPSGTSTNGAWAYKASIPRKYIFIDGLDTTSTANFNDWFEGRGWPQH